MNKCDLGFRASQAPPLFLFCSYFQAWCQFVRDTVVTRAQHGAFQDSLWGRALGAVFATWREASWAQEQRVARASVVHWRSCLQQGQADRHWRRARAYQDFMAWRVALGSRCEAQQHAEGKAWAGLCWTTWVRESSLGQGNQAHDAQQLSAR